MPSLLPIWAAALLAGAPPLAAQPTDVASAQAGAQLSGWKNTDDCVRRPPAANDGRVDWARMVGPVDVPLVVKLAAPAEVNTVEVWLAPEPAARYEYKVEVSRGGEEWSLVAESGLDQQGWQTHSITPVTCDRLRVTFRASSLPDGACYVGEVAAWQLPDSAQPSPLRALFEARQGTSLDDLSFPYPQRPITDEELFGALDLEQPGLEAVRAAVEAGDWPTAQRQLRDTLGSREAHIAYTKEQVSDKDDAVQWQRRAEEALKGQFCLAHGDRSYEAPDGRLIAYARFPAAEYAPRECADVYGLSHVAYLIRAYAAGGRSLYADTAAKLLQRYFEACHGYGRVEDALAQGDEGRSPWSTWAVQYRVEVLAEYVNLTAQTHISPELFTEALKCFLEDERLLAARLPGASGYTGEMMAATCAQGAIEFPEFREARDWFGAAAQGLTTAAQSRLLPDGATPELSPGYAAAQLYLLHSVAARGKAVGSAFALDAATLPGAERTLEWLLYLSLPNGDLPVFNDSDGGDGRDRAAELSRMGLDLADAWGREDLRWFAQRDGNREGPPHTSYPFQSTDASYAGLYAMRSGWSGDAKCLIADFGPYGLGGHPDFGSFALFAMGTPMVVDPGAHGYDTEWAERYFLRGAAHNTLVVDGVEQSSDPSRRPPLGTPVPGGWVTNSAFDAAWGTYDFAPLGPAVQHERLIYFAKPSYYLVLDRLQGEGEHTGRLKFQLAPWTSAEAQDEAVLTTNADQANLLLAPLDARSAPQIVAGRKDDGPFGWEGWVMDAWSQTGATAAPAVIYEGPVQLPALLATVLWPYGATQPAPKLVKSHEAWAPGGSLFRVQAAGAEQRDLFGVGRLGTVALGPDGRSLFDADFWHLRLEAEHGVYLALLRARHVKLFPYNAPLEVEFADPFTGVLRLGDELRLYGDLVNRQPIVARRLVVGEVEQTEVSVPCGDETWVGAPEPEAGGGEEEATPAP